jgi:heme-degrading monooxygenase HmoA
MGSRMMRNAQRVTLKVRPERIEDFLTSVEEVHSKLRSQNGIRRIYLFRNPVANNEFLSLTLWNDDYSAEGTDFLAHYDNLGELLESPPVFSEFEIVHHEVNEDLPPPPRAVRKVRQSASKKTGKVKARKKKRR